MHREGVVDVDSVQLAHLLRRTEFVARPNRMTELAAATRSEAIDNILNVTTPVAIPAYVDHDIDGEGYNQWVFAVQWWTDRMVDSPKPMQERMAFFWHGHFCSGWDKVNSARAMMEQNALFRDSAFGNFRTMTHTMSVQPAMLFYLDNLDNVKTSPNQNFARELMELFTIGVVDQNGQPTYTEDDVSAAAAAWTGHGIDWDTYLYKFWTGDHDYGTKTFMGQSRAWNGPDIINYLLQENVAKKMVACKFLSKKLWEHFAHEAPSQTIIDALAQVLFDNDFAIKPWVKAMLMRDEFYAVAATQGAGAQPTGVHRQPDVLHWLSRRGNEPAVVPGRNGPGPVQSSQRRWLGDQQLLGEHKRVRISSGLRSQRHVEVAPKRCEQGRPWPHADPGGGLRGRHVRSQHQRAESQHRDPQRNGELRDCIAHPGVGRQLVGEHQPAHDDHDDPRIPRGLKDDDQCSTQISPPPTPFAC